MSYFVASLVLQMKFDCIFLISLFLSDRLKSILVSESLCAVSGLANRFYLLFTVLISCFQLLDFPSQVHFIIQLDVRLNGFMFSMFSTAQWIARQLVKARNQFRLHYYFSCCMLCLSPIYVLLVWTAVCWLHLYIQCISHNKA